MMRTPDTMTDLLRDFRRRLSRLEHRPPAPRATWGRVAVPGAQGVDVTYPVGLFNSPPVLLTQVEGAHTSVVVTAHTEAGFHVAVQGGQAPHTVNWHALSTAS